MAQIPNEIKQDPNWARAVAISKQYAVSTYPATWVLKFINEWNAAVARLRRQECGNVEEREAIAKLKETTDYRYSHYAYVNDTGKAFDMAIKALEKQGLEKHK